MSHFFCLFGLVGWMLEKISRVGISVNYETYIACGKCAAACPSTVMGAILRRDMKTIPDCFAYYPCRDVCLPCASHFRIVTLNSESASGARAYNR